VIDSVSNVFEEATDIMNEKSMRAGDGRIKAQQSVAGYREGRRRRKFSDLRIDCHGLEMRLPCLPASANLVTSRI
jgi:hypothetical protein